MHVWASISEWASAAEIRMQSDYTECRDLAASSAHLLSWRGFVRAPLVVRRAAGTAGARGQRARR